MAKTIVENGLADSKFFVSFLVILVRLIRQGLSLPDLIRKLGIRVSVQPARWPVK